MVAEKIPEWKTEMRELSPAVYAYIQAKGSWFTGNSGLIVGKRDNVVIDTLTNDQMVSAFIAEIREVSKNPINLLINTHDHHDHRWTNHYFPEAKKVCHIRCREETMKEINANASPNFFSQWFPEIDFTGAKNTPHDIVFDQNLTIFQDTEKGPRDIRLLHLGPAHTTNDLIVYLPKEKVAFCGDLLFAAPCTPFVMRGYFPGYIRTLDYMASLDADFFVPGHGPGYSREALYEARKYLIYVYDEARKRFRLGMKAFKAAEDIDLGIYAGWSDAECIIPNVERAYSEFRGEPAASPLPNKWELFSRMIEYRKTLPKR